MADDSESKEFVRSVMIQGGLATVDMEIFQSIVDTAGSNFIRLKYLAECLDPRSEIENLVK